MPSTITGCVPPPSVGAHITPQLRTSSAERPPPRPSTITYSQFNKVVLRRPLEPTHLSSPATNDMRSPICPVASANARSR